MSDEIACPYPRLSGAGAARLADGGSRLVVVGAGGWLGMATLELLHGLLGTAFADRVVCFGSRARSLRLRGGFGVAQHPLNDIGALAPAPTLVLHNAFLTQEKAKAMAHEDYVAANRSISRVVFEALDRIGTRGVFLPSSGAVYMTDKPDAQDSMRLYGELKRADESWLRQWAEQSGRPVAIARVFNLSGPYINKQSSYALACFINDALGGRPINILADRPVFRSFVAIRELMSIVFGVLTAGEAGWALFDTAGDRIYEMGEIADVVRQVLGRHQGVDRRPSSGEPAEYYVGDGAEQFRLGHRFGVKAADLRQQVDETARFMVDAANGY